RARARLYPCRIRRLCRAATRDASATATLTVSDRRVRRALAQTSRRLRDLRALKPAMTPGTATGILWFYLGHQAWHLLIAGQQWSWDDAEQWLGEQAATALLDPGPPGTPLAYATS